LRRLCEQASVEQDRDRLYELVCEINALLDQREQARRLAHDGGMVRRPEEQYNSRP